VAAAWLAVALADEAVEELVETATAAVEAFPE
jgi:hypothetical protein